MTESLFLGPKLKIARAQHHIRELEVSLSEFVHHNPHRISIEPDAQGAHDVFCTFDKPIPDHFATIVGDAAHNLRAALDHLACDLVRRESGAPNRYTGFPIYEKEADFNGGVTSKLKGASRDVVKLISSMKPYGNSPLRGLHLLDNDDKHIVLIPCISVMEIKRLRIMNTDGSVALTIGNHRVSGNGKINAFGFNIPGGKLESNPQATFGIQFANTTAYAGRPVIETLSMLTRETAKVINVIEAFIVNTTQATK